MYSVFNIGKLDLLDDHYVVVLVPLDQDIIRFHICSISATA